MSERLVIDLDRCAGCPTCTATCAYFYRPRTQLVEPARPSAPNHGVQTLRERATFMLVCRRCSAPSCIEACRFAALERQESGVLKRYNLRCVSCKLCAHACPFGVIYPEMLPFYETPCDFCGGAGEPPCVTSCEGHGLTWREVAPDEPDVHILDEHLAVVAARWDPEATGAQSAQGRCE